MDGFMLEEDHISVVEMKVVKWTRAEGGWVGGSVSSCLACARKKVLMALVYCWRFNSIERR